MPWNFKLISFLVVIYETLCKGVEKVYNKVVSARQLLLQLQAKLFGNDKVLVAGRLLTILQNGRAHPWEHWLLVPDLSAGAEGFFNGSLRAPTVMFGFMLSL